MRLTANAAAGINLVKAYSATELRINDSVVHGSCILSADQLIEQWRPTGVDELRLEDFEPIYALQPEIILIGSGARQRFPDRKIIGKVMGRGIGVEVMDTGAACRTYNILVSEDRRVVAALFL